ncbi:MAG: hypothetical protein SF187_26360 [Deltaproteobacteria bacterium]|nr:hypothetical protein [Deltaproteobacteria bacterium]
MKLRLFATFAALVALPAVTQAQTKDASLIVGQGRHTYRWQKDWLKLPAGMTVGQTHGDVVIDRQGHVIFSTDTNNAIVVAEPDGRISKVWGHNLGGGSHGLRLAMEGNTEVLWVAHLKRHAAIKFSLDGRELMSIPYPTANGMYKNAEEYLPTALDVAPNGDIYVVDGYGRFWLHRFDAKGQWLQSWNGSAREGGAFKEPHGVGLDLRGPEPRVVVADRQNHRLQLFTLNGDFVSAVTEDLRRPSKVVTQGDSLLVVDLEGRVSIFDKDFKVVAQLGDNENPDLRGKYDVAPDKWKDGQFTAPHGAAWDKDGNLYVEDWNAHGRVSKLVRVRKGAAK